MKLLSSYCASSLWSFLHEDMLAVDDAAMHSKGENTELVEWPWEEHGVAVIFPPTHSPELNSNELVWCSLVMKLWSVQVSSKLHASPDATFDILANVSHNSTKATHLECECVAQSRKLTVIWLPLLSFCAFLNKCAKSDFGSVFAMQHSWTMHRGFTWFERDWCKNSCHCCIGSIPFKRGEA